MLKIRRSKLVVTDRFHGVIFSFITRTPVLAFKSFDTKISSGIRWFRNLPSIFYAEAQNSSSIENFVNEYYNVAAEEKISSALNCKVETDSRKRFFNALDKIATTNKIYPINSTPPSSAKTTAEEPRRLTVDAVNISERRIAFKYTVQGDWKKYFNINAEFFIEYSEDISKTPKDIAIIPFLCNVLPMAWVLDAEIFVDELDYDFYEHLLEIEKGYVDMYPRIKFGGKLKVGKLINHDYEVGNRLIIICTWANAPRFTTVTNSAGKIKFAGFAITADKRARRFSCACVGSLQAEKIVALAKNAIGQSAVFWLRAKVLQSLDSLIIRLTCWKKFGATFKSPTLYME